MYLKKDLRNKIIIVIIGVIIGLVVFVKYNGGIDNTLSKYNISIGNASQNKNENKKQQQ